MPGRKFRSGFCFFQICYKGQKDRLAFIKMPVLLSKCLCVAFPDALCYAVQEAMTLEDVL